MAAAVKMAAAIPAPSVEKLVQLAEVATSVQAAVAGHDAVLEPKYDGWRVVVAVDDAGVVRTYTRKGTELTGAMPAIEAALGCLPPGSVLDCEAVVFADVNDARVPKGSHAVTKILGSGTKKAALLSGDLTLVVFDLIRHGDVDARTLPLAKRRAALEGWYAKQGFDPTTVVLSEQLPATDESHDTLLAAGWEGSVVKWTDASYKSGARGWGWFKLKGTADVDAVVIGFKPGENSWTGMVGAIIFGQFTESGLIVERGRCSGIDFATRTAITKNPDEYVGRVFSLRHNGVEAQTAEHPYGAFRHPRFKEWRPDKPMEAVTLHDA